VVGGIGAAIIVGFEEGFGEVFMQKWQAFGALVAALAVGEPVGQRIVRALKSGPRYTAVMAWAAVAIVGTLVFAALGPFVGPVFEGWPAPGIIYPGAFLVSVIASGVTVLFGFR
jgi:drug/metabolite transporter (DMT)-like permease